MKKQVELEFGVDIDDADPHVVRVWDGEKSYPCRFSTEADAKLADARSALAGRAAVRPRAGDEPRHGNGGRE